MKMIPLTQGKVAFVDDEDYEFLIAMGSWYAHCNRQNWYVRGQINGKIILMHRIIMERIKPGFQGQIDHKDMNGFNNQHYNLRIATKSQNAANVGLRQDNITGYKGVSWNSYHQKWKAQIQFQGTRSHLGYFDCKIKAAKAYDCAAWCLWKDYARLNFPEDYGLLKAQSPQISSVTS